MKFAPLGRSDGQGNSIVEGYASLFGVPDQNGDIVEKGAFQASLKRLKDAGRSVKLLWQHDPQQPIGVWDKVVE
ncbi:MAG: HK97 family phage prohead protease, partial [Pseudomonadota bacterium]